MATLPRPCLWPLLFALALPACLDLPKMNPGNRVVDDFTSGDLKPTWSQFGPWSCDPFKGPPPAGPVDAGADDGAGDAGDNVTCGPDLGSGQPALRADFQLVDPTGSDLSQAPGAEVVIRAVAPVNLTAFTRLAFFVYTEETLPLPSSASLSVGLGCSIFAGDPLDSKAIPFSGLLTHAFPAQPQQFTLSDFGQLHRHDPACLAQVDSIHFAILPNNADGRAMAGTLHIGSITLQN